MTTVLAAALGATLFGCHSNKQPLLPAVAPHTANTTSSSGAGSQVPAQPASAASSQPDVGQDGLDAGTDGPLAP